MHFQARKFDRLSGGSEGINCHLKLSLTPTCSDMSCRRACYVCPVRVSLLEKLECCAVKLAAGGLGRVGLHNKVRGKKPESFLAPGVVHVIVSTAFQLQTLAVATPCARSGLLSVYAHADPTN